MAKKGEEEGRETENSEQGQLTGERSKARATRTTTHEFEVDDATLVLRGEGRARECQLCRLRKVNGGPVELGEQRRDVNGGGPANPLDGHREGSAPARVGP